MHSRTQTRFIMNPHPARSHHSRHPKGAGSKSATAMLLITLLLSGISFGADLEALLSGKKYPLSVQLGKLDAQWRRFTIHTTGNASGNISVSVTGSGGNSGSSQNNVADITGSRSYLTKGETESAGGQTYLVAYGIPGNGLQLSGLVQALVSQTPPVPATLSTETTLSLALLDLKSVGSLDDIRVFDLKREIAESEKAAQAIAAALKSAAGGEKNSSEMPAPISSEK
jgi:hypothetical protein